MKILSNLANKRILLLQGPVGPFFYKFASELKKLNSKVYKINFNGGDWIFYPTKCVNFSSTLEQLPFFLNDFLNKHHIQVILLFGDCRPIHKTAIDVALRLNIEIVVLEEGYIRPNYITIEKDGVNANSTITRSPDFYLQLSENNIKRPIPIKNAILYSIFWSIIYYVSSSCFSVWFKHYKHHRPLTLFEAIPWLNNILKRCIYHISEKKIKNKIISILSGKYFLVPLQVSNDRQIIDHSKYDSIEQFISEVISSFANNAPADTYLVIKNHPMDIGHNNYKPFINYLIQKYKLTGRVYCITNYSIPTLLKFAKGTVVINSTVGLSSLYHSLPTKVCGNAVYDIPGLVFPGSLDEFWNKSEKFHINKKLFSQFYNYLIDNTQLNRSFYKCW